jgi:TPR repeat protein
MLNGLFAIWSPVIYRKYLRQCYKSVLLGWYTLVQNRWYTLLQIYWYTLVQNTWYTLVQIIQYANGKGVKEDKSAAKEWFGKSCDNGIQEGCDKYRELKAKGY